MDDIVKRIRQQSYFGLEPYEAADEIEQLRQRVQELEKELELSDALQRDKVAKLTAIPTDITQILDEVRKQERERCAELCEKSDRYRGDYFAAKIRAME